MAAAAITLSDERRDAGQEMMRLTDSVGFDAVGAGWGFSEATQAWRFYLFTDMVDTKGPLWVWERLLKALSKFTLPAGITPLDIFVSSPEEWLYRNLPMKMDDHDFGLTMIATSDDLNGSEYGIDRLWLLRFRPEQSLRKSTARQFDLKVRRLMAA
jgi:hypothetical protein